mmetsp:Transcript_11452/g.20840  ORF Transcript_11452/g.20840 Transcript_11452/m.20840 type:complete len:156 (+) Transcript_11452:62-529(+)
MPLIRRNLLKLAQYTSRRTYFTIPSVRFSPSHTKSHKFAWKVAPNQPIACYDLIYECTAYNVTIFDGEDDPGCRMQVECCEEGILSYVAIDDDEIESRSPDEMVGILSTSTEEHMLIQQLLGSNKPNPEQTLSKLRQCESLEFEGQIPWEAYLAN